MAYSSFESANLTASVRTANILSGDINEFVSIPSIVNVYAISSAAGVHVTFFADSDVAMDNKEIVAIGTSLDKSAHLMDSFMVAGGTRLAMFFDERAAAATTDVLSGVEVLPL